MSDSPTFDRVLPRPQADAHLQRLGARRAGGRLPEYIVFNLASGGQARADSVKGRQDVLRLRVWSGKCPCEEE